MLLENLLEEEKLVYSCDTQSLEHKPLGFLIPSFVCVKLFVFMDQQYIIFRIPKLKMS